MIVKLTCGVIALFALGVNGLNQKLRTRRDEVSLASAPIQGWSDLKCDSTGKYLVATTWGNLDNSLIYTSSDYGATWAVSGAAPNYWGGVASSSSGQYLYAGTVSGTTHKQGIYYSSNFGSSWNKSDAPSDTNNIEYIALDTDTTGQYVFCGRENGNIYKSSNFGVHWSVALSGGNWRWIACDGTCTNVYAVSLTGISASSNRGANWNQVYSASGEWLSVDCDSSGQYVAAVLQGGGIYTSSTFGSQWRVAFNKPLTWVSITSSENGQFLVATASEGIYVCSDHGTTWTLASSAVSNGEWYAVTSGSSGQYVSCTNTDGYIYFSRDYGHTWINNVVAPSLSPSQAPSPSPSTFVPTLSPTQNPSINPTFVVTQNPSINPTFVVTQNPSANPTFVTTHNPTMSPTLSPSTPPSFNPSFVPTDVGTRSPTGYQNYIVVGSSATGTTGSDKFVIDSTGDVELTGNGGNDRYVIHSSSGRDVTITDFGDGTKNTLDLTEGFPDITSYQDIQSRMTRVESDVHFTNGIITQSVQHHQVTIILPGNQHVILLNIPATFRFDESNFVWVTKTKPPQPKLSVGELIGSIVGTVSGFVLFAGIFYNIYIFARGFAKRFNLCLLEETFVRSGSSAAGFATSFETFAYYVLSRTSWCICGINFLEGRQASTMRVDFLAQLEASPRNVQSSELAIKNYLKAFLNEHKSFLFEDDDYTISAIVASVMTDLAAGYGVLDNQSITL
jgi:hypothetical protein